MRIARLKISNILGIADFDFVAGAFNKVSGQNGSGKTSVLEALKSVIKGGTDATLLRRGAEKGEVVIVLDDDTTIRKRVTPKTQTTSIQRNGVDVQRPMETIAALTDMLSVNPVDFLRAPKKQRTDVLLDSLPVGVDQARLEEIVGSKVSCPKQITGAFEVIAWVYGAVFEERTGTNRAHREKEATINQLAAALPPPEEEVGSEAQSGLLAELNRIDGDRDAEMARIETKLSGIRTAANAKTQALFDERDLAIGELEIQIEAIQKQIAETKETCTAAVTAELTNLQTIEAAAERQRGVTSTKHAGERAGAAAALDEIKRRQTAAARAAQTRETIATMRSEAEKLAADAQRMTTALDRLQSYKTELLAALPIDGLAVIDGEILRHGVPFDRLNTQQQVEIATEIAKLRAGKLGVICVDGLELLDNDHFEAFREQALKSGLQMFVTRVTDGAFEATAEN